MNLFCSNHYGMYQQYLLQTNGGVTHHIVSNEQFVIAEVCFTWPTSQWFKRSGIKLLVFLRQLWYCFGTGHCKIIWLYRLSQLWELLFIVSRTFETSKKTLLTKCSMIYHISPWVISEYFFKNFCQLELEVWKSDNPSTPVLSKSLTITGKYHLALIGGYLSSVLTTNTFDFIPADL